MKGLSFEQFLVLKKKKILLLFFLPQLYEHDSQLSKTIWTNSTRFNSRIEMKFVENWLNASEEKLFNNIMILYMYIAQGQGKITLAE